MLTEPATYQIRVKGHLEGDWPEWFEGLTVSREKPDETLLSGQIADQVDYTITAKELPEPWKAFTTSE